MEKVQIRLNDSAIRNLHSAILVGNRPHSYPYRGGVLAKLTPKRHKNECPDIGQWLQSSLLLHFRQGDEKNIREFVREETRALLISPILFDNELQKCYNLVS